MCHFTSKDSASEQAEKENQWGTGKPGFAWKMAFETKEV